MRTPRLLVVLVCVSVLAVAAFACGDDDDDDRLTDEEYFAEVDELAGDLSQAVDEDVIGAESARAGVERFAEAAAAFGDGLAELTPPVDLDDLHQQYEETVADAVQFLDVLADDLPEDSQIDRLHNIITGRLPRSIEELNDPDPSFGAVEGVECELVAIAEERDILLDFLICEPTQAFVAGDNPVAVQATEFEFSFEEGAFTTETTGIVLTNAGEQIHEAFIARIAEDAVVDEILASETGVQNETEGVEEEFDLAAAQPGSEDSLGFRPGPGRYLMVCYVEDDATGQPHAELGMVAEFTVE